MWVFLGYFSETTFCPQRLYKKKRKEKEKKKKRKMLIAFKYVILLSPNFPSIFRCPLCACVSVSVCVARMKNEVKAQCGRCIKRIGFYD